MQPSILDGSAPTTGCETSAAESRIMPVASRLGRDLADPGQGTGQPRTFAGINLAFRESKAGPARHNETGYDRPANAPELCPRQRHGAAPACGVPAHLAGQPAVQSWALDPGGRRRLGH